MSVATARQRPPFDRMEAATSSSRASVRPATTACPPKRANAWATSRPSPEPPPVMTATLLSNSWSAKTETAGPAVQVMGSPGKVPAATLLVVVQHVLGDEDAVDLVGAVGQAERAGTEVHLGQGQVARDTGRPPDLDGPVDDAAVGRRNEDLDRTDLGARLRVALVHLLRGVDRHQASGLEVHVTVGDEALHELLVLEEATVHLAGQQALDHQVEGTPHLAHGIHAVEDPAGAEAVLRRPVAVADLAEQVRRRDADLVVPHLAVIRLRAAPDPDTALDDDARV